MTLPDISPRWQPIGAMDRRVLGVLIEKAKTTPDNYPLSLNSLKTGCNQKSNRFPQMQLEEADIEDAIERLRAIGAVAVVQGISRIDKYRHFAYEWLGVDKVEIAVMAELLLRGAQTVGELRGRAARMEPIPDLAELRPILAQLVEKKLIVYLTPPGRGAVVTHNLYLDREMEKLRREYQGGTVAEPLAGTAADPSWDTDQPPVATNPPPPMSIPDEGAILSLRADMESLKQDLARMREALGEVQRGLNALREDLGA
ncbi:MAG: DUF480 domain-containing protein [Pirellulales bacterium]|nr:DUF480 domain-containing protein [Pirellulales bacterium]